MSYKRQIQSALISVFNKDGLQPIVQELRRLGVTIYSTGGTQSAIEAMGGEVVPVEAVTNYPSILGGRVKTLHPKVFGGILHRRDHDGDQAQIAEFELPSIDLVVVDLYPFEETVASGASEQDIIEKIDIGGIALIRGAAKNFNDVVIVPSMNDYRDLLQVLKRDGVTSLEERKRFASRGFRVSSHYDTMIHAYLSGSSLEGGVDTLNMSVPGVARLALRREPSSGWPVLWGSRWIVEASSRQGTLIQQSARRRCRRSVDGRVPKRRPHVCNPEAQQCMWLCHALHARPSLYRCPGREIPRAHSEGY